MLNSVRQFKLLSILFLILASFICLPLCAELKEIPMGSGKVEITIESVARRSPKGVAYLADRVEIWLGTRLLTSLNADSPAVSKSDGSRLFAFAPIDLKAGYYFLGIRLYRRGALHGREKSRLYPVQIGVHPGRTSVINKQIHFFVW